MKYILFFLIIISPSCNNKVNDDLQSSGSNQISAIKVSFDDSLKIADYWKAAKNAGLHSTKRQKYLDSALMIKPDSAYFWQQKAMPLYKARKYAIGKPFLKKAVLYDPKRYLDYSGFMKCIFSKEYDESILEFMEAKKRFGDSYVMDHTYNFYIGLDYLQLNQFDKAKEFLTKSKEQQFRDFPEDPAEEACHYLDWFYLGIVDYELGNYQDAINNFDMSLNVYTHFAEALYFKSIALRDSGLLEEAEKVFVLAMANTQNTINEDNVFYEIYPYQVFHRLSQMSMSVQ